MNNFLYTFQNDENTREAVKQFIVEYFNKVAVDRVFEGEKVEHLKDARDVMEEAFVELRELYQKEEEKKIVNEAR
jgi:hypothetical protein